MSMARGFDGAKRGPRAAGWRASSGSSTAELLPALGTLRNRARDLVRNNPHLRRALKIMVANAIGTGVQAKWTDEAQAKAWKSWVKYCDAEGLLDFFGLQAKAYRSMKESGEVLIRLRRRLPSDGFEVPLQLQVLEIDYLDTMKVAQLDGGFILAGVQFNLIGQRMGYWLFDQHPGEVAPVPKNMVSRFVPASEVIHLFDAIERPNTVRGFPWLATAIWAARDLDEYQDAERIRKKIEACFAAFVKTSDDRFRAGLPAQSAPGDDRRLESLSPGMIEYLRPDEEVTFAAPATNDGYESGVRIDLRAIAAGTDTTYEQLTGDYSQVNFTSGRMGKMEFKRMLEQELWLIFIPMLCELVAGQFCLDRVSGRRDEEPRLRGDLVAAAHRNDRPDARNQCLDRADRRPYQEPSSSHSRPRRRSDANRRGDPGRSVLDPRASSDDDGRHRAATAKAVIPPQATARRVRRVIDKATLTQ